MNARDAVRCTVLALAVAVVVLLGTYAENYDFRAFYCAGAVAREGANPYRTQPLYTCEQHRTHKNPNWKTNGVLPAPFPGYVIAAVFEPVSLFPYPVAARLWTLLLGLALAGSAIALRIATKASVPLIALSLCLSIGLASLSFGEIVPLFFVFLCWTMVFAQRQQWTAAAICSAGCLVEPHLGLPVCFALALWAPRTRAVLGISAIVLGALSISALGVGATLEYFSRVLPYHALSEIGTDRQFGLATILYSLGTSESVALQAGSWSYLIFAGVGVAAARKIAERFGDAAYFAAVPAAAALLGGVFLHVTQMIAVIPLTLLLLRDAPKQRWILTLALALLAVPFVWILNRPLAAIAAIVAVAILFAGAEKRTAWLRTSLCAVPLAFIIASVAFATDPSHHRLATRTVAAKIDPNYAQSGWAQQNTQYLFTGTPVTWSRRIPTWLGLCIVIGVLARAASARKEALPNILANARYDVMGESANA